MKNAKSSRPVRRRRNFARKAKKSAMVKLIKRTISNTAEKKHIETYGINVGLGYIATANNPSLMLSVQPTLVQGLNVQNRTGNRVRPVSGYIRGSVNMMPYNATTNTQRSPVQVLMWLIRQKQTNLPSISSADLGNFFNVGSSSATFQYNPLDAMLPVNKDLFTVLARKRFKIGQSAPVTAGTGTIPTNDTSYSRPFYFDLSKHYKKVWYYNDGNNTPINQGMMLVVQSFYMDGQGPNSETTICEMHYALSTTFTDY